MVLLVESGVSDSWYLYIAVWNVCDRHRHNDTVVVVVVVLAVVIVVVMWMMMVWWRTGVAVERQRFGTWSPKEYEMEEKV
ncbi:protein argonaute 18-like [Iris pallida]|uniref:Protein argonaute 18-like n=1 Tax=Iris pallida TaxID=29817 RepID=A0AAX6I4I7_IRIPA|nr:protein argonaute 18-like [Iris pallida]